MRKRCNGVPIRWLGGVVSISVGGGMLLACLLPNCVFLIGIGLICCGAKLVCQNRR